MYEIIYIYIYMYSTCMYIYIYVYNYIFRISSPSFFQLMLDVHGGHSLFALTFYMGKSHRLRNRWSQR